MKDEKAIRFPDVQGKNLARNMMSFPEDFHAPFSLVFIAFQQWQQTSVNSWIPFVQALEAERDDFTYYEFPVIDKLNPLSRWFINEGMRAGIPNAMARQRTITLYLDKDRFRGSLGVEDESQITLLLCDADGRLLWRANGEFTPEIKASLLETLHSSGTPAAPA